MPTIYFIFAHLVGDFLVQSRYLLKWKLKDWKGLFVHVLIHFGLYLLVFAPYLLEWKAWVTILLVSGIHFGIDDLKIWADERNGRFRRNFWIDQGLHLGVLVLGGYVIAGLDVVLPSNWFFDYIYNNYYLVVYLALLVFIGPIISIIRFQKVLEKDPRAVLKWNYKEIWLRIGVFSSIYAIFMLLGFNY